VSTARISRLGPKSAWIELPRRAAVVVLCDPRGARSGDGGRSIRCNRCGGDAIHAPAGAGEPDVQLVGSQRAADGVALDEVAAPALELPEARVGFNAFGNRYETEVTGEIDRRGDDRGVIRVALEVADK
jgi:hypothetical protein